MEHTRNKYLLESHIFNGGNNVLNEPDLEIKNIDNFSLSQIHNLESVIKAYIMFLYLNQQNEDYIYQFFKKCVGLNPIKNVINHFKKRIPIFHYKFSFWERIGNSNIH